MLVYVSYVPEPRWLWTRRHVRIGRLTWAWKPESICTRDLKG